MDKKQNQLLEVTTPIDYNFERMLKQFIKTVEKSGILKEVKARRYYEKPSAIQRRLEKQRRKK